MFHTNFFSCVISYLHHLFGGYDLKCPLVLQEDIKKLSYITKRQHMIGSELMENFQTSQFTVRMSRDTYSQLRQQKKFLSERKHAILWNIIQASIGCVGNDNTNDIQYLSNYGMKPG